MSVYRSTFVAEQSKVIQLYYNPPLTQTHHPVGAHVSLCLSFPFHSIPLFLPSSTAPSHRMLCLPENKRRSMERDKAEGGR